MSPVLPLLLLYVAALVLRVAYIFSTSHDPTFLVPVVDSATYLGLAEAIARGEGLPADPLRYGPLYPYLLGLWYKMAGGAILPIHLIQVLFTSLGAPLIAIVGYKTVGRAEGLLAGILLSVYWPLIYFDGEFLVEPVLIPLLLLLLLLLIKSEGEDRNILPLSGGIVLGLCAVARPNALLLLPAWMIRCLLRRRWAAALLLLAGCTIPIAPVAVRNQVVGNDLVMISSTGGINFYLGNNEKATGRDSTFPGLTQWTFEKAHRIAEAELGRGLKPSEVSRFYLRKGLSFVCKRPIEFLILSGKKIVHLISSYEMPNVKDLNFHRERSWFLSLAVLPGFGVIVPLAVVGILRRGRNRHRGLVLFFAGVYALSVILFFVNARYRLPIAAVFLLYAGAGLTQIVTLRKKGAMRDARMLAPLAAALVAVNWNPLGRFEDNSQAHFNVGWASQKQGNWSTALEEYAHVDEGHVLYPLALNNKAIILRERGDADGALSALKKAVSIDPTYFEGWANLGGTFYRLEEYAEAAQAFERTVELWPYKPAYHVNLGLSRKNSGDLTGALAAFERALASDETFTKARGHRAEVLLDLGRAAEATADLERVVREEGHNLAARHNLARAYSEQGREGEARRVWEEIIRIAPDSAAAAEAQRRLER